MAVFPIYGKRSPYSELQTPGSNVRLESDIKARNNTEPCALQSSPVINSAPGSQPAVGQQTSDMSQDDVMLWSK